ncbi:MAG: ABC transporter substrate-binding protein [Promethearchaeota archaeon]
MKFKTKRVVSLLLIVLISIGITIGTLSVFKLRFGHVQTGKLLTPGMSLDISENQIIKIGVLSPLTEKLGEHQWKGVYLAVQELNEAGGVFIDGTNFYFGLIGEDTYECDCDLNISDGIIAAQKMVYQHNPNFIIGGFRTEAILAYQEAIMNSKKIFINTGAFSDILTKNVERNYDKYKYFFQITSFTSTNLAKQLVLYLGYLKLYMSMTLNRTINKVAIIREDLEWTIPMINLFKGRISGIPGLKDFGWEISNEIVFPITASSSDFIDYWKQIQNASAQVVIPLISTQASKFFINQYKQLKPKCLIVGVDLMSQLGKYWHETGGACEYEIIIQPVFRINKTDKIIEIWDKWVSVFGEEPSYMGLGAYDSVYVLYSAIQELETITTDEIVKYLEGINKKNYFIGASGNIAFTNEHNIVESYDKKRNTYYGFTFFVQWQAGGKKECLSTGGLIYRDSMTTAQLIYPNWGIN